MIVAKPEDKIYGISFSKRWWLGDNSPSRLSIKTLLPSMGDGDLKFKIISGVYWAVLVSREKRRSAYGSYRKSTPSATNANSLAV